MANILSMSQILESSTLEEYLRYLSADLRSYELDGVRKLCMELLSQDPSEYLFDGYSVGYKIAQISKEFDLLRIGSNAVVNIELKSQYDHDKILKQLQRNRYYLKFLNKDVKLFTYVSDTGRIFELSESGKNIDEIQISRLITVLAQQTGVSSKDIDKQFNPSNYLVSPFNSTNRFIDGEYFLTNQQQEIKKDIIRKVTSDFDQIISINGRPGTGKTLLLYDIARALSFNKVLMVHVGKLNTGHITLRDNHGFNIIPVKHLLGTLSRLDESSYGCIVVDEAQRIKSPQISEVFAVARKLKMNIIIGYDSRQVLSRSERLGTSVKLIKENVTAHYSLTDKIRTNQDVSLFIKILFNLKYNDGTQIENVSAVYFSDYTQARNYINTREEYRLLNFTPSILDQNKNPIDILELSTRSIGNAHEVIGQEFDNVLAVIDGAFYYDNNGVLTAKDRPGVPYDQLRMLFQIVTRTRNRLEIVVVDNEPIFKEILKVLKQRA